MAASPPRVRLAALARRHLRVGAVTVALAAGLFAGGSVLVAPNEPRAAADASDAADKGPATPAVDRSDSVGLLREQVRRLPEDPSGWARLGLAYVEQGRTTADAGAYARAEAALRRSQDLRPRDNYEAELGEGALAAARHDFGRALTWGRRAAATQASSAPAQGVIADALTQLGRYQASFDAVQRMVDLRPDASSLARASYTWELRGDTGRARDLMRRALDASGTASERAFARTHLSQLALENGQPKTALREAQAGLRESPDDPALLEARARAYSALDRPAEAVADYRRAIARAPLPHLLLGLGELQQSRGETREAEASYALLRDEERIRRATGGDPDVDAILFEADHGDPRRAVAMARQTLRERPFIAVHDALAWALHRAGQDEEALEHADSALSLGTRSALFRYHRAMIHLGLGSTRQARDGLEEALALQPGFHPLHAPKARRALDGIDTDA